MATARRTKKAEAPAVDETEEFDEVVVSDDVDTDDFDLEEDAVEEAPAPKAKAARAKKAPAEKAPAKPKAQPIEFGSAWLAEFVNKQAGTSYDSYNLRILLRKLTKDGVLERAESEGRARYSFTGPTDPQVTQIVEAVKSGAADKAKQERLDKLKADRAEKKAAAPKKTKAAAKAVEAEPEVDDEDDFEVEDI